MVYVGAGPAGKNERFRFTLFVSLVQVALVTVGATTGTEFTVIVVVAVSVCTALTEFIPVIFVV